MGPGGTEAAEGKEAGAGTGEEAKGEGATAMQGERTSGRYAAPSFAPFFCKNDSDVKCSRATRLYLDMVSPLREREGGGITISG